MAGSAETFRTVQAVVAIPVRDEAERITDCLLALSSQQQARAGVVLLVNNTSDATVAVVESLCAELPIPVLCIEHRFAAAEAHAGAARRLAMQHAARVAPEDAPLLCTDADGRAEPDWLARNLHHLAHGADAVFGRAEIDPVEAQSIPPALHQADARECAYARALDEIEHRIDPDPADPWPRHTEHSGASIAVTRAAFERSGGFPSIPLGEDRAFFAALRRADARIRHAPDVRVTVSGRILGRAPGGMADTIRRRLVAPDLMLDDALEPVAARIERLRLRRAAREAFARGRWDQLFAVASQAGLDPATTRGLPTLTGFGAVWEIIDHALPQRRIPVADLADHMGQALQWLEASRETVDA